MFLSFVGKFSLAYMGDMDMDFGDAQKESIEGSDGTLLKGTENSPSFLQHNDVEAVISHNKPKKGPQLKCYRTRYFCNVIINIFFVKMPYVFN